MGLFDKVISGAIQGIGNTAVNVINAINAPKEEKDRAIAGIQAETNRHEETLIAQAGEIEKAYLADVQNARDDNVKIQESSNASWLSKNVAYLIDLFVMLVWGSMTVYIALRALKLLQDTHPVDFSVILGIYSGVTGVMMTVLNFHRGSSKGSEDKGKTIDKMMKA